MKRGQVWIETVIYTLVALIMIGISLSFIKPKIEEMQDKTILEQSKRVIEDIQEKINSIRDVSGNQRVIDLTVERGVFKIDGIEDSIFFEIETGYEYSEPGVDITEGNLIINTEKKGEINKVTIKRKYSGEQNITYKDRDEIKQITKGTLPYKISILNNGRANNMSVINFDIR